jgi:hypothetical protein
MKSLLGAFAVRAIGAPMRLEIGGGSIDVTFDSDQFDLPQTTLSEWVTASARAVSAYFGKFPVDHCAVRIAVGRRNGVSNGRSWGEGGARTRIFVGQHSTEADLKEDWILTHEMVHFGFPSVEDQHHWIEEGTAVYVEPIARARIGALTPEQVWGDMERDMPQGLPQDGDQGLDHTHTWARTYWGGAMFCLLADIEIRKRTGNRKGFRDALRAINQAGGNICTDWPLQRALEVGAKATDGKALVDLYNQMSSKPVAVDLPAMWKQLGVERTGRSVRFNDKAPLAGIRKQILA